MNNTHLKTLLAESSLSPEALGLRIGISGMSIRRWLKMPPKNSLPKLYANGIHLAVHQMVADGLLKPDSKSARFAFAQVSSMTFQSSMQALGCTGLAAATNEPQDSAVLSMLTEIGGRADCKSEIEHSTADIESHRGHDPEWARRISILLKVIRSKDLLAIDKVVAFGALFYLVFTFDLIPDNIPVLGLIDDFAILGIAATFYINRKMVDT